MARVKSPSLQNVEWLGNIKDTSWGHRWRFWAHRPAAKIPEHQFLLLCVYTALCSWIFEWPLRDRYPEFTVVSKKKKISLKKNKNLSLLFLARRRADLASNRCHYLLPKEHAVCSLGSIRQVCWSHLKSSRNRKDGLKKVFENQCTRQV